MRRDVCKHFSGTAGRTCMAGVAYRDVATTGDSVRSRLPCFGSHRGCKHREFPTAAEVEAFEREMDQWVAMTND